jgi:SAM-dependent methyltransferase
MSGLGERFFYSACDVGGAMPDMGLVNIGQALRGRVPMQIVEGALNAALRPMAGKPAEHENPQSALRAKLAKIYLSHIGNLQVDNTNYGDDILSVVLLDAITFASQLNGQQLNVSSGPELDPTSEALKYYREFRTALLWANEHLSNTDIMRRAATSLSKELRYRLDSQKIKENTQYAIIDIGCGPGRELALYQELLGDLGTISAFDQSAAMVEIAHGLNPEVNVQVGDLFNPDPEMYPPGSALAVSAIAVLHHFDPAKQIEALRSMRSLLTDRGLLLLTMRHGNGLYTDPKTGLSYYRQTFKELKPILEATGFRVIPESRELKGHDTPVRHVRYMDVICEALPRK